MASLRRAPAKSRLPRSSSRHLRALSGSPLSLRRRFHALRLDTLRLELATKLELNAHSRLRIRGCARAGRWSNWWLKRAALDFNGHVLWSDDARTVLRG